MKMPTISLFEWQKKIGAEKSHIEIPTKVRWPHRDFCVRHVTLKSPVSLLQENFTNAPTVDTKSR